MPFSTSYPSRVVDLEETRRLYGERVDQILPWLLESDPLADNVVEELARHPEARMSFERTLVSGRGSNDKLPAPIESFFDAVESIPDWLDWERLSRAGELFFRTGILGGIVLGAKSLCYGYCSPAGNKPLIMTGQLSGKAVQMRLVETSRYVVETCRPGGLRRPARGFELAIRVRIMHAAVRRLLRAHPDWSDARWGIPINQHDMLGTALLFSQSFIEGIRQFGFAVSSEEAEDYLHLWRYATHLMGLEETLFPRSERDAMVFADIILRTQGAPDADSRTLVHALVRAPMHESHPLSGTPQARAMVASGYGFCRGLLGDEIADALELPENHYRLLVPAFSRAVSSLELLRRRVPGVHKRLVTAGERHWERSIERGRQGRPTRFAPPTKLDGARDSAVSSSASR